MNRILDAFLTARGVWKYHSYLNRSQFFSDEQIRAQQAIWLSTLLEHCYHRIPWYSTQFRDRGVRVTADDPFAELTKLPILSKSTVRENHAYFCSPSVGRNGIAFATSGTTGEPLTVYTSPEQWIYEQGVIWRHWKWAGYRFRDRIAVFRSYAPRTGQPRMKHDPLRNWTYFSVFQMDETMLDSFAEYLVRWKPRFLRGYPSSLLLVAQHAIRRGYKLPGLRGAFTASEVVADELRTTLRDALDIEVFDHYGQAEITCMFHECDAHRGMHVLWEYGFVELLPSGVDGLFRIIATNFHNRAMPLLRYDTGDLAVGHWEKCTCGRTSPVLKAIQGRADDYLLSGTGTRIPTVHFYTYFSKLKDLKRFQMLQVRPGELVISLELWREAEAHGGALRRRAQEDLTAMTGLSVSVPDDPQFIQTADGKFPAVVQQAQR
jgi:phenylacetate-CoA ligase